MGKPDGAEFLKILEEIIGGTAEVLSNVREWEADAVERGDEEAVEVLGRMRSDIDSYGGTTQDRMMSVLRRMMGEGGHLMGLFALVLLSFPLQEMEFWPEHLVKVFYSLMPFGSL